MKLFGKRIVAKIKGSRNGKEGKDVVKYIHPSQINGMHEWTNGIIQQLSAAVVIIEKLQCNSCEVEQFKMYKKMFHELWVGVAEQYNYINNVDIDTQSDEKYIA